MAAETKQWRCSVCGYVHVGDSAPEFCPVCGADQEDFEPFAGAPEASAGTPSAGPWQCQMCNALVEGDAPPAKCPVCGAAAEFFSGSATPSGGGGEVGHIVVIGAGIAGVSAAEAARRAAPQAAVTLLSREPVLPYYRLNLTRYLAGDITMDELPLHDQAWYAAQRIDLWLDAEVASLEDGDTFRIVCEDGRRLVCDRLILAPGSHPFIPPLTGTQLPGVHAVRTAADANRLLEAVGRGGRTVCIGGGVLGLETAGALARRGVHVTLLESHEWLMPRQLNRRAADRLERFLAAAGIALRKEARTAEIVGSDRVRGVRLVDGTTLDADVVVITTGVRPNTALARRLGLEVNTGIVVDSHMRTSHDRIYAAGDAAEHNGVLYGLWGASLAQGTIAGMNASGASAVFGGLPRTSALKVLGLDVVSIGRLQPEDGSWVVLDGEDETSYRHFVFRDGLLVGAILIGESRLAAAVRKAVEEGRSMAALLAGGGTANDVAALLGGA